MNFDEALRAHIAWKSRLAAYLRKPDGSIKVVDLGADNLCALGQWIYGEAKAYSGEPEYKILVAQHAAFHRAAAEIVRRADAGENVVEELALGASSPYALASAAVVNAISDMRRRI